MPASPKSWWSRQLTQLRSHLTPRAFGKGQYFDSPKSIQILRSASSTLSLSIGERFSLWIQGRQDEHFGPKCRLPELFQRRDKIYLDLQAQKLQWNHPPPKNYHDVLSAAANVGAIEERLGYRFKDRLLGIEALKNSEVTYPMYFNGQICKVEKNNRLALLGDRILTSVLCDMWYDSGQSTLDYHRNVAPLETRFALNKRGRDLRIDENVIIARDNPTDDQVAETFEAIIGAIYEDSGKDIRVAKTIIKEAGFDVPTSSPTNVPAIYNASVLRPSMDAPELKKRRGLDLIRRLSLSSTAKSLPTQQTDAVKKNSGLSNWLTLGKLSGREPENENSKQERHQGEELTAKDSSTATKTVEILQQEQPRIQGLTVNDSSNFMADSGIPQHESVDPTINIEHAIGERKESIWVKAMQKYDRLQVSNPSQSGGSPASVEKIYCQMMQQEVRARRVEQKWQSLQARKKEELEQKEEAKRRWRLEQTKLVKEALRKRIEKEKIRQETQEGVRRTKEEKESREQKERERSPSPKELAKATEKRQKAPTAETQNLQEATEIARPNKESILTETVVYTREKTEYKATKHTHHVSSTLKQERQPEANEKAANPKVEVLPAQNPPVKSKKDGKKSNVQSNGQESKGETVVETRHASTSTRVTATSSISKQNAPKSKPPQSQPNEVQSQQTPDMVESLKKLQLLTAQLQKDIDNSSKPIEIEVPQLREKPQEKLQQNTQQKLQEQPQQKSPKKLGKPPKPPHPQTTESEVEVDKLAESTDKSNKNEDDSKSGPAKTELQSTIVVPRQPSNDNTPSRSKPPPENRLRKKEHQSRSSEKETQSQQGEEEKPWKEDALATQSQQGAEGKPWRPWRQEAQETQWQQEQSTSPEATSQLRIVKR